MTSEASGRFWSPRFYEEKKQDTIGSEEKRNALVFVAAKALNTARENSLFGDD
jgi:hypothetical protein